VSAVLRWLGHSTATLDAAGVRVVTDPVLRKGLAHLRRRPPLSPPEDSAGAQLALVSHLHHDHCDLPSLRRLRAQWVVAPPGAGPWLQRRLGRTTSTVVEVAVGTSRTLPLRRGAGGVVDVTVTALPAHHAGHRTLGGLDGAPPHGEAVGHLVRIPGALPARAEPDLLLWAVGDTGEFPGDTAVLAAGGRAPDLALVPVGGWGHTLGPHHLDPAQAADLVRRVRPRYAVPVHWGTLHPVALSATMGDRFVAPGPRFAAEVAAAGAATAVVLRHGELLRLDDAGAVVGRAPLDGPATV
jgi:L-ascorbate metabolism protein UlaG (beta-lactamase superfamily)